MRTFLYQLFENNIDKGIQLIRTKMREPIPTCDLQLVISLCNMFECFLFDLNPAFLKSLEKPELLKRYINYVFVFAYVWSMCSTVSENDYNRFDDFIKNTVRYECFII